MKTPIFNTNFNLFRLQLISAQKQYQSNFQLNCLTVTWQNFFWIELLLHSNSQLNKAVAKLNWVWLSSAQLVCNCYHYFVNFQKYYQVLKGSRTLGKWFCLDLIIHNALHFVQNYVQWFGPAGKLTEYILCWHCNYNWIHLCLCRVFPFCLID